MEILNNIKLFFVSNPPPAPVVHGTFNPFIPEGEPLDEDDLSDALKDTRPSYLPEAEDIQGTSFAIEYLDSRGNSSTRRITLYGVKEGNQGQVLLYAKCHERKAMRSFRADRIQSIIDLDGEVHTPNAWLSEFVGIPVVEVDTPVKKIEKEYLIRLRSCRDGVKLLAALSHCDNKMVSIEIEIIVGYIESCWWRTHPDSDKLFTDDERDDLRKYINRLKPADKIIDQSLDKMSAADDDDMRNFIETAFDLILADGILVDEERELGAEMARYLGLSPDKFLDSL